jgi:predicted permease
MLSYGVWQRRFGERADVVGQTITLGENAYTIVGVLPADFHFAPVEPAEFWVAMHADDGCGKERGCHSYSGVARLKDGVNLQQAQADLQAIMDKLGAQDPDADAHRGATVVALPELIVGRLRPTLLTLMAGAAMLMLIACVNVSSLLLVRAQTRRREIAVRGAMGASPARIVRQLIIEGLVLVGCGVAAALTGARFAMQLLLGLIPEAARSGMPYLNRLGLNGHVIGFAAMLSVLAVALFCLLPALRLSRVGNGPEMRDSLASSGRGFSGTMWKQFGSRLVIAELAVAMVLLVGAGLLTKSFWLLLHKDIGLEAEHLVAMRVSAETLRYAKDADVIALQKRVQAAAAALPGVQSAAIVLRLPVGPNGGSTIFRIVGRPYHGEHTEVVNREVDAAYFPTVRARLLRGRNFAVSDDADAPPVMIINRAMEQRYFAGEEAIGQKIAYDANSPAKTIVGIVNDIQEGPLDADPQPVIYVPVAQETWARFFVVARTTLPETSIAASLTQTVRNIDPTLTVFPPQSMSERIHDSPAAYLHRSTAWIVAGFAAMALLLGMVGIYGVIAYSVSQRTREIGVRIALGAQRNGVYRLVLTDAARVTAIGIACGAMISLAAATLLRKLLFEVAPWDAATFVVVAVGLAALALIASFIPAHRAAGIDPMRALRAE